MRARRSIATIAMLFAVLLTPSVMATAVASPFSDAQQTTGHNTNPKVETVVRSKSITVSLNCGA